MKVVITTNVSVFGATITDANKNNYPLSNVTYFRYSTNITTNGTNDPYNVTDLAGNQTFVSSIPSDANETSQYSSQSLELYNQSTEITKFGIIVDYYYQAVNFIRTNRLSSDGINRVVFTCDFSIKVTQG